MHKPVVLFDIDYTLFDTKALKESNLTKFKAYEETLSVLEELFDSGVELGIFSKGDSMLQGTKLKKTGIDKFFQKKHIHVFEDKDVNIKKVMDKYSEKKLFLIDDKLPVLHMSKTHNSSIFTIWVKRGPFAENQKEIQGFKPDATVISLKEVVNLILNT